MCVASFVLHSKSAEFSLAYRNVDSGFGPAGSYDSGVFDLESWACATADIRSFQSAGFGLQSQCMLESGSRACSLLLVIFAVAVFGGVVWDMRAGRNVFTDWRMDSDEEMDKIFGADEDVPQPVHKMGAYSIPMYRRFDD